MEKSEEKLWVLLPEQDLGLQQPEQHTLLTEEQAVCAKEHNKTSKGLFMSLRLNILSSDSGKGNHVASYYPLKMHILVTETQWFHRSSPTQRNIRPPSADYWL